MNTQRRDFWFLFIIGIFVIVSIALLNSRVLLGKSTTPALNKAVAGTDIPYIVLGMGCFWGAEQRMQMLPGVLEVETGYAGGDIPAARYEALRETEKAIRKGKAIKNNAEVVKVYYDPKQTTLERVLIQFWESHDPTQGNRQGADVGSNYRSAIFYRSDEERQLAERTRTIYQGNLKAAGVRAPITTEIAPLRNYRAAETYHQDYLEKSQQTSCCVGGIGVAYRNSK